ncbi:MAG TPA: diguanylate cyclase [Bradyrhizobium sp.]|nr:diguanylate cyclase [Bradyrhizobium sp.]
MSGFRFRRKEVKFEKLLGIRARLVLLALILVTPLMLERTRSLEDARNKQIARAYAEFSRIARHSADAQRDVISSVETVLKSTAHIQASKQTGGLNCDVLRAGLPVNLPWIRNLVMVGKDGRIQCATLDTLVGLDLSDRAYFKRAKQARDLVFSDFLLSKSDNQPILIAAYPVSAIDPTSDTVIVAGVNLEWMSKIMSDLGDRPGILAALVDSVGTVLAAPADHADMIGRPLSRLPLLSPVAARAINLAQTSGSASFSSAEGTKRTINFTQIPGTQSRLIVGIDEARVAADINREIRNAYLQLGLVCLFVLIGALVAAETLIIRPINTMVAVAKRFGRGEWSVRAANSRMPAEFVPLASAFDTMAAQLAERERELIASNDRLTVMASIDMLSGLANRRGFQSRLDFEWMRAQQHNSELSLLMIDVDHFKPFNDTYGHPEGDACLSRIGETLAGLAAETMGFAGRYGGEEFCLLLPNTDEIRAREIGEMVRTAVLDLAVPHATSSHQTVTVSVGVASTRPGNGLLLGDLIEAADASLYAAKRSGRNAVAVHGLDRIADDGGGPVALAS